MWVFRFASCRWLFGVLVTLECVFFFEVGARRARRVICGTDPRKHMLINFDVLCRWCLTYITFCLGTMQLCHIDGWWTLLCSGLFGSARCLPLVVRCGAGERAPRFFWCGKKALRFLDFFFVMIFHSGVSMIGLVMMVIIMSIFYLLSLVWFICLVAFALYDFLSWCLVDTVVVAMISLCFLYECFFFNRASPFPAVPCTWGFAFYCTTKYQDIDVYIILLGSGIDGQLLLLILYLVVN